MEKQRTTYLGRSDDILFVYSAVWFDRTVSTWTVVMAAVKKI